jgi:hypothetical protein
LRPKNLKVFVGMGLLILVFGSTAWPQNSQLPESAEKRSAAKRTENVSLPKPLEAENIDHIIAGLSDEQARRLLINELKLQAQQEKVIVAKAEGVAGFIGKEKRFKTDLRQLVNQYFQLLLALLKQQPVSLHFLT